MKLSDLEKKTCVCYESFCALKEIIKNAEKRHNTKIYLDSHVEIGDPLCGKRWTDTFVYLHGDRNVVNIVCLKLITWQHRNLGAKEFYLYAYPVGEMK